MDFRLPASGWAPLLSAALLAACAAPSPHPAHRPAASSAHTVPTPAPTTAGETRKDEGTDASADVGNNIATPPAPSESSAASRAEVGLASWYGGRFHGRRTASGERYDRNAYTAAHRSLPFNAWVRVRHLGNGREVLVRITDRGPFVRGRVIDLSQASAQALGLQGLARVSVEPVAPPPVSASRGNVVAAR